MVGMKYELLVEEVQPQRFEFQDDCKPLYFEERIVHIFGGRSNIN